MVIRTVLDDLLPGKAPINGNEKGKMSDSEDGSDIRLA